MEYISFIPQGLSPTQSYRVEVYNSTSSLIFVKHNVSYGQQVTVPISIPGSYLVKIFNSFDIGNNCQPVPGSEQTIDVFFPITSHIISETDCNTESYTVSITVENPLTSGDDLRFGWGYSVTCTGVEWTTNSTLQLPSDGNTRYVFVSYRDGDCCKLITSTSKVPCTNCNIQITNLAVSCSNTLPGPPGEICFAYRVRNPTSSSRLVVSIDCETLEVVHTTVTPSSSSILICSPSEPIGDGALDIELLGECPNSNE